MPGSELPFFSQYKYELPTSASTSYRLNGFVLDSSKPLGLTAISSYTGCEPEITILEFRITVNDDVSNKICGTKCILASAECPEEELENYTIKNPL